MGFILSLERTFTDLSVNVRFSATDIYLNPYVYRTILASMQVRSNEFDFQPHSRYSFNPHTIHRPLICDGPPIFSD